MGLEVGGGGTEEEKEKISLCESSPLGPLPCSLPQLTTTKLGRARVPLTI